MQIRHLCLTALIALTVLPLSGCFLRFLLGMEEVQSIGEEIDLIFSAVQANATTSICRDRPFEGRGVECNYIIDGQRTTSTFELISELGVFGVIVDPVVLELPDTATNIRGRFEDGDGNTGDLIVYPNLAVVPVDDNQSFFASAGKQLVVLDLPSGAPVDGVDYSYSLDFERVGPAGSPATEIKVILTGKLELGGKTFYPPAFPCTTDLESLPSIVLPRASTPQPLAIPSGQPVCSDAHYIYFAAESFQLGCDLDNDGDVDRFDLSLIMDMRNTDVDPGDPRDTNESGRVDANDARVCARSCTRARCAA